VIAISALRVKLRLCHKSEVLSARGWSSVSRAALLNTAKEGYEICYI